MAESKNNPSNRAKAPEQITGRKCDDGCGQFIPARQMLTVMSTSFNERGKKSTVRKHYIRDHYKAA